VKRVRQEVDRLSGEFNDIWLGGEGDEFVGVIGVYHRREKEGTKERSENS